MLLTEYTVLTELDLSCNNYGDTQGCAIAEDLRVITSLTQLDLTHNYITADVKQEIRGAWAPRKSENLLLDVDTEDGDTDMD